MTHFDSSRNLLAFLSKEGKILKVYSGQIAIDKLNNNHKNKSTCQQN